MSNVEIKVYGVTNKFEEFKVKRVAMKIYDLSKALSWAYTAPEDHEILADGKTLVKPEYRKYWDAFAKTVDYFSKENQYCPYDWKRLREDIPGFANEDDEHAKLRIIAVTVANYVYNPRGIKHNMLIVPTQMKIKHVFGVDVPTLEVTVF